MHLSFVILLYAAFIILSHSFCKDSEGMTSAPCQPFQDCTWRITLRKFPPQMP